MITPCGDRSRTKLPVDLAWEFENTPLAVVERLVRGRLVWSGLEEDVSMSNIRTFAGFELVPSIVGRRVTF